MRLKIFCIGWFSASDVGRSEFRPQIRKSVRNRPTFVKTFVAKSRQRCFAFLRQRKQRNETKRKSAFAFFDPSLLVAQCFNCRRQKKLKNFFASAQISLTEIAASFSKSSCVNFLLKKPMLKDKMNPRDFLGWVKVCTTYWLSV